MATATFRDEELGEYLSIEEMKANARRIVACVNACTGYATEELESHPKPIITGLLNARDKAEQQRDDLLEAMKLLLEGTQHCGEMQWCGEDELSPWQKARTVIAEIEASK